MLNTKGFSSLIKHFYDTPELFIFHAGWDQALHLTEEVKNDLLKAIPVWEHDMRRNGIPAKGSGAIFQTSDEDLMVEPFDIPSTWSIVAGIDFGRSRDPSTIVYATMDPDTETYYIIHEEYLDSDRSPEFMAQVILNSKWPNVVVVPPHDVNNTTSDSGNETRATILREAGVNLLPQTFSNSPELQLSITSVHKKHMGKEGGLVWMGNKMKEGKMKVFNTCTKFFEEKRSYFYIMKGGKFYPKDGDDHIIDAARIATISLGRFGNPVFEAIKQPREQDRWSSGELNTAQWRYTHYED